MLVSLKNIKQYVSLDGLSPEEIAHGLTFAGVEVEDISYMASGTNLVIGQILECENHPDSDHLHVLKVDLGQKYGVEQIVCGAPNARKGLKVIVSRVGAKLPGGEIKKGCIRGVESNGMCCSLLELGVDSKYLSEAQTKGIEELPEDAPVGEENVLGYLGLDDVILDLSVLANRPDLYSLYNVAREIGAIFDRKVNIPTVEAIETFKTKLKVGSETERCSQFAAKEIKGIVTKESPKWLQAYLQACGIRSINNIVDIGNYVMLLTGQPLHMYDAQKLAKAELIARDDFKGDFIALDEKTYAIQNGDIVITTDKVPMCLGGVMGGLSCAVDENTKNVYIESASFDGASVRKTSNRLGLSSDSSQRFVKGTNHFQSAEVINLASSLLKELCEAKEFSNIVSYAKEEYEVVKIITSAEKINNRLGTKFDGQTIKSTLERLQFKVRCSDNNYMVCEVPSFRLDVTGPADISEEVIRLQGLDKVVSELPSLDTKVGLLTLPQQRVRNIRNYLLDRSLDECLTYSLVNKNEVKEFNLVNDEEPYKLLNPLTDDREYFRTHIVNSLLQSASYNIAHGNKDLMLFENSHVQTKQSMSNHLAIVLVGNQSLQGGMVKVPFDFYHIKGLFEGILSCLGIEISRIRYERIKRNTNELHPGKAVGVYFQNNYIGAFGELHPNKYNELDLGKTNCVLLEINILPLIEAKIGEIKMAQMSKYQAVNRDLSFLVEKNVAIADIVRVIKVAGKGIVKDANVFDVYEGSNIDASKKSVAISIIYQSDDHTLTDKELVDAEDKIKFALSKECHVELRA